MRSLAYEIARQGGALIGLAQIRLVLVFAVIACQSAEVTESFGAFAASPMWLLPQIAWCGLFALLGFGLQASRARHDLRSFGLRRLRRFAPAYGLMIALAILALGPAATSSSVANYFRDGESWAYFLNLLAIPQSTLPGVFEFNVLSGTVNAVVYRAPAAVLLIAAIAIVPLAGRWQAWSLPATTLAFLLLATIASFAGLVPDARDSFMRNLLVGPAMAPLLSGLLGAIAWDFKSRIPLDRRIGAACVALLGGIALLGNLEWLDTPLLALPLAIPSVWLALQTAARRRPGELLAARLGPLLYPALCFGFAIQQLVATTLWGSANAAINLAASLPPIMIAAAAYWAVARRVALVALLEATTAPEPPPQFSLRKRRSFADRATSALWVLAVGAALIALLTALMALTGYALQRPPDGM